MAKQPIKVQLYVSLSGKDGPYKRWEDCSPEEIETFRDRATHSIERTINEIAARQVAAERVRRSDCN